MKNLIFLACRLASVFFLAGALQGLIGYTLVRLWAGGMAVEALGTYSQIYVYSITLKLVLAWLLWLCAGSLASRVRANQSQSVYESNVIGAASFLLGLLVVFTQVLEIANLSFLEVDALVPNRTRLLAVEWHSGRLVTVGLGLLLMSDYFQEMLERKLDASPAMTDFTRLFVTGVIVIGLYFVVPNIGLIAGFNFIQIEDGWRVSFVTNSGPLVSVITGFVLIFIAPLSRTIGHPIIFRPLESHVKS